MSAIAKLRELFENDFAVNIDYSEVKTRKVVDLFSVVRDLNVPYTVDEYFEDTWMGRAGYNIDNWEYFGICEGSTHLNDGSWTGRDYTLEVEEFEALVKAAQEESQAAVNINSAPVAIVLGDNLVVSGGVVVVNYKTGKQYHLNHKGKATFDVASRTVITEHTFLKDGQDAYERVEIKLENLESVQSDTLKLTVSEDGAKVEFTTTFTL